MSSATWLHSLSGLCVRFHTPFSAHPGPRNDHCPFWIFSYPDTNAGFSMQSDLFFSLPHTMSLYIDMTMIRSVKCSGGQFISPIIFWIFWSNCNVVCPGKIFHSSHHWFSVNPMKLTVQKGIFSFHLSMASEYWWILPRQRHRIRDDENFCCRQLDCPVVQQSCPLPWLCIPINRRFPVDFLVDSKSTSVTRRTIVLSFFLSGFWWNVNSLGW